MHLFGERLRSGVRCGRARKSQKKVLAVLGEEGELGCYSGFCMKGNVTEGGGRGDSADSEEESKGPRDRTGR